ncbi:hypothetical protein HispidOSU_030027, partial [Sigmodon hispidus]
MRSRFGGRIANSRGSTVGPQTALVHRDGCSSNYGHHIDPCGNRALPGRLQRDSIGTTIRTERNPTNLQHLEKMASQPRGEDPKRNRNDCI